MESVFVYSSIAMDAASKFAGYVDVLNEHTAAALGWSSQHLGTLMLGVLLGLIAGYLYHIFCRPFLTLRTTDYGYQNIKGVSPAEASAFLRRWREPGEVPPPYPNGWYVLTESWELKKGQSKSVNALGQTFAVFRDELGDVHALDAYCPHLGANLGVGGRVKGDCIECPFHGWRFRGSDGKCAGIPYSDSIPEQARVRSWTVIERTHHVYVWWHAEEDYRDNPLWLPDIIPEIEDGEWNRHGMSHHYVSCHIEEISANGADVAHLPVLHGRGIAAGSDPHHMHNLWGKIVSHTWGCTYKSGDSSEIHTGYMRIDHDLRICGRRIPGIVDDVCAKQQGPGVVYLTWKTPMGRGCYLFHTTPVEPMLLLIRHSCYTYWPIPRLIAKFFLKGENVQFERDIFVWNSKRYNGRPVLTRASEDGTILKHRRWFKQFYSENSLQFTARKDGLDW